MILHYAAMVIIQIAQRKEDILEGIQVMTTQTPLANPSLFYAAIAVNRNTGDWGWSTGTLAESSAIEDAKNNCEKQGMAHVTLRATQLNGCLAMASSRGKNGSWSYFLSNSGTCGSVEKEALSNCRASKAKNCKIEIHQLDSEYQYLVEPLLRN